MNKRIKNAVISCFGIITADFMIDLEFNNIMNMEDQYYDYLCSRW